MMKNKIRLFLQHVLPQHFLSRQLGRLCECKITTVKNYLIKKFIRRYHVDLSLAVRETPEDYHSFNDFFTRDLKPKLRPISRKAHVIVSPVDGAVSQIGPINGQTLIQAKGRDFTLSNLLAGRDDLAEKFQQGLFSTLYLAPKDYHCVHMPLTGHLRETIYIPGQLFSVNQLNAQHVDNLFARNERLVCLFDTDCGPMAVILVGAFFVAGIHTTWSEQVTPCKPRQIQSEKFDVSPPCLLQGEKLGHFQLGSTVILLLPENRATWSDEIKSETDIIMGQAIGYATS